MKGLTLRAACPEDEAFLLGVYASTREEELAPLPWPATEKTAFLAQQGAAQHAHYRAYYKEAEYSVILSYGATVGRLYVARWPGEIRIMDIALLPDYRNAGIGTRLITDLLEEAALAGKSVSAHVESFNRARRLYERLGFCEIEDKGVYRLLRWKPGAQNA
jgi:ribosomal protein S18 acetylase RimI-like enzyme